MRVLSASDIDRLLDFPGLIERLSRSFAGFDEAPQRHHHAVGGSADAMHLLMPAWTGGAPGPGSFLGTKIVNVFRGNTRQGLPAVLGTYLLQSGETGAPLAILDGTRLTYWRTAAASALAARHLARPDSRNLLMVGSGALAPFLVRAHAAVLPVEHVTVWNHRPGGAERLAAALRQDGIQAEAATKLEAAARQADIISCATLSTVPVIRGAWLRPGQHLDLVGAFTMTMREVDDDALRGARLFVDTADALHEGGDVAIGLRDRVVTESAVQATLHDLCRGTATGRRASTDLTLFKSTGSGIEDLAAAVLVWDRLESDGLEAA